MYTVKVEVRDSSIEGKGYFAGQDIPLGTIVYFYSRDDKRYTKDDFQTMKPAEKKKLMDYGVEDEFGNWVVTASGPYTNHSCNANILPLFICGRYTSIAVKDIKKGEEITIDYGQFFSSEKWSFVCKCKSHNCRNEVGFGNNTDLGLEVEWSSKLEKAVANIRKVSQPINNMDDKYALIISKDLQEIGDTCLGKQIKFSLIKNHD